MHATCPHFLLFSSAGLPAGGTSRWQFVLESIDGSRRLAATDEEPGAPSERAELLSVVRGLEALDQPSRVTLVTPSRYVSRGISRCLDDWRTAQWQWERFGRIEPIRDSDLWQRVDRALGYHEVDCRTWPAADAAPLPALASQHGLVAALAGPNDDPAVLIVRSRAGRNRERTLLRAWLTAGDTLVARCGELLTAALRSILPLPRSA